MGRNAEMILMTPGPVELHPRVRTAMSRRMISHRSSEFRKLYRSIVSKASRIFQTSEDIFVVTGSSTCAIDCVAASLSRRDFSILVPVYGVFSERLAEAFEASGARVTRLEFSWRGGLRLEMLEDALTRDERIEAVALVHNETSTGVMVDLERAADLVKSHGKLLIVDAVSSLGGVDLPVDKLGVDICIVGSQKCLAAPPGLSMISISKAAWKLVETRQGSAPPYLDLARMKRFQENWETPFTPAINLFYGLDEALNIILEEGLNNWIRRHERCSITLYEELERLNLAFYPKKGVRSRTVLTLLPPKGGSAEKIVAGMKQRGIIIAGGVGKLRGKVFRIACMGLIDEDKARKAINALKEVLSEPKKNR